VAVDYLRPRWPDEVREALAGRLPTVVLDGVSGALGRAAVDLLEDGGRLVQFGWASGQPLSVDPDEISARHLTVEAAVGARIAQRPGGMRELETRALENAATGVWSPLVQRFGLARASAAHAALEARATVGKTVLVP
jgi:NADPH2:quinone reductase